MASILEIGWSYSYEEAMPSTSRIYESIYTSIPAHGVCHKIQYTNFEGELVKELLNPPEMDIIRHSLFLLVASTQRMNQTHLLPEASMMVFQQNIDGHLSELIKVACQALVREADTQSSEIRRKHDANAAAFRRQRDAKRAQSASLQNSLAPINRLPVEVFSHILTFASLNGWDTLSHTEVVRTLATVGRYWFRVVVSTPQIWSTLEETMSPKQLKLAIERSRSTPLRIFFQGTGEWWASARRTAFSELVVPHMERWRTLVGENLPENIVSRLESGAPSLLNLRLQSTTMLSISPILGEGAQLKCLNLTAIGITWASTRLQGLRYLSLSNLRDERVPSVVEVIRLLAHSPHLEVLVLHDVAFASTPISLGVQQNVTSLTPFLSLQRLQLTKIPSRAYYHFLTRLRFPNCKSIDLAPDPPIDAAEDDQVTYRHDTPSFAQQIRSMLLSDDGGPIQVSLGHFSNPRTFYLSTYGRRAQLENIPKDSDVSGFSLRLRKPPTTGEMGCLDMAQEVIELVLQACPASALHLDICLHSVTPQYPVECLARLNNSTSVEGLSVSGSTDIRSILQYLAQPLINAGKGKGTSCWLYPQLKTISLQMSCSSDSVVAIRGWVKERWVKDNSRGLGLEGSVEVTMPSRKGGKQECWRPVARRRVIGRQAVAVSEDGNDDGDDD